jgi:hypothetical protein
VPGSFSAALGSIDLSSGSGFFGNTPIAGSFTDTLTFTVTTLSTFNGSITSAVNGTQDVDFTSIVVTPGSLSFVFMLGESGGACGPRPPPALGLAPGVYTLTLNGTNSASMGSYGGNLALTPAVPPTPVPEPESYALLLAGPRNGRLLTRRRRR